MPLFPREEALPFHGGHGGLSCGHKPGRTGCLPSPAGGIPSESNRGETGETHSELREMMEASRKNSVRRQPGEAKRKWVAIFDNHPFSFKRFGAEEGIDLGDYKVLILLGVVR
jgi:hypothetical protein